MIYGYDFTGYSEASLRRRLSHFANLKNISSCEELEHMLISNESNFESFIRELTVNVTAMFRDPEFYKCLREKIVKRLATYPFVKIWVAGCSTGEEVYSLSILLHEEGLLNKTVIYATDLNQHVLEIAKEGIYSIDRMKGYMDNYIRFGGKSSLSEYYTEKYNAVRMNKILRQNLVFSVHNLVMDQVFNEFQLILCRNVLIYFNKELQGKTINLLYESLCPLGILCLGSKESLLFADRKDEFRVLSPKQKIYIRKN